MSDSISRRDVLKTSAIAGATLVGTAGIGSLVQAVKAEAMVYPWPYKKLKSKKIADLAYEYYYTQGGCMISVFKSIAESVANKLGDPYTTFPFGLAHYGAGGVSLWGTLCGTLNGAAMAIALFHPASTGRPLINELFAWYEQTKLPDYKPAKPFKAGLPENLPKSLSESTLCHTSVSRWVATSGFGAFSAERADRCGRLCGSVAQYTVDLLNLAAKNKFVAKKQISPEANACLACHGSAGQLENEPDALSKMNCEPCHDAEIDRTKPHF